MGSSFLTIINALLALYSVIIFLKTIIQFGLPNHPARFTMYLVCLCAAAYFSLKASAGFALISPMDYLRFRTIPIVGGGLGMLLQIVTSVGQFSHLQQKVISRIPLMASLLVYFFFPSHAEIFFGLCVLASVLFYTVSVGKARYQKRMFFKMSLFLTLAMLFHLTENYWTYVLGDIVLFPAIFYFFIIQQSYGVTAMVEQFRAEN
jgi:hypothetical protein